MAPQKKKKGANKLMTRKTRNGFIRKLLRLERLDFDGPVDPKHRKQLAEMDAIINSDSRVEPR